MKSIATLTRERRSVSRTSDLSVCPTCGGTGWRSYRKPCPEIYGSNVPIEFAEKCPDCNGGLAARAEDARKRSSIPQVFYDKGYSSFDWRIYRDASGNTIDLSKEKRITEDFLRDYHGWKLKGIGFYIYSHTKGSGKTFLASCLGNELMKLYGIRVKFVNANQLLEIAQSGDKDSSEKYEREPIKLLCDCEVLVLDDVGQKRNGYDWMNSILYRITDDRMINRAVTIFTSNSPIEELEIDDRIKARIKELSAEIAIPEYNVRGRESYDKKLRFLRDKGLI